MRCAFILTALATVSSVFAAPLPVSPAEPALVARGAGQDCKGIPPVDNNMVDIIYRTVRKTTKDHKVLLITYITALQESNVNDLNCGDRNSVGLYQQQYNYGWGTVDQLLDPVYATNAFLKVLMPLYRANPDREPDELAQDVQRAVAGNKYRQHIEHAEQLIREAAARAGNGGGDNDDGQDDKPTKTETKTATKTPEGAVNVGSKPTDDATSHEPKPTSSADNNNDDDANCDDSVPECDQYYVPVPGDNCYKVADRFNISLEDFYNLNPEIDDTCQNLYAGKQYCVAAADVPKRLL